jgi:hypothetical protein
MNLRSSLTAHHFCDLNVLTDIKKEHLRRNGALPWSASPGANMERAGVKTRRVLKKDKCRRKRIIPGSYFLYYTSHMHELRRADLSAGMCTPAKKRVIPKFGTRKKKDPIGYKRNWKRKLVGLPADLAKHIRRRQCAAREWQASPPLRQKWDAIRSALLVDRLGAASSACRSPCE